MLKRLIKTNITLVVVIVISIVISLGLLGLLFDSYSSLNEETDKINDLRRDMSNLSNNNSVSPHSGNLALLKSDREYYNEKLSEIKHYFGNPYRDALADAAKAIYRKPDDGLPEKDWDIANRAGDVDSFSRAMVELLTNDRDPDTVTDNELRQALSSFAIRNRGEWEAMANAFQQTAQKGSVEKISDAKMQEFFLVALGFKRFAGYDVNKTNDSIAEVRKTLSDMCRAGDIALGSTAAEFAMTPAIAPEEIAGVFNNIDIAGDLSRRIIKSGVSGFDEMILLNKEPEQKGDFWYFNYRVRVHGTQEALRNLLKILNDAYADRRMYVVRSVKLRRIDGEAELIRQAAEGGVSSVAPAMKPGANPDAGAVEAVEVQTKIVLPDPTAELGVEMAKRRNYAVPVLGREKTCFAEIDVAYVVYVQGRSKTAR